jgi:3-hydroxybutyrate dehydrogenase
MKTVLITGSTSGIGLGIALEFAKTKKYNIVFHGLEENGNEIANQISKEFGVKSLFSNANLKNQNDLRSMVEKAMQEFGSIDVLVNNAGIQFVSAIEDFPDEKWNAIIDINLSAAFYLTKAVWAKMKENKFGRIINIASAHGLVASEYKSAYVSSKHGLIGLTKTTALEGASFNITCNAICPGYVKTPLVEKQIADQAKTHGISESEVVNKVMLYKQAVKEFIPVELLGQAAVFLAQENSTTLTGISLPIDGGWNAQ